MRLARLFAFFLDLLICAACADAAGLAATAVVWFWIPGARPGIPAIWAAVGAGAVAAFLLRDARGGRSRRWLGLEAVGLLVRMGRGAMMGVDQNKGQEWVGASAAFWPAE